MAEDTKPPQRAVQLVLADNECMHPLHQACMQLVVGVRQKHSQDMLERYADRLEKLTCEHIGPGKFPPGVAR